jgi:AcrR family transcriptional regulator
MQSAARTQAAGWRDRTDLRERTSRHLLAAVDELLGEGQPWTTISVGQLVKRARISRSTFYNQFEDKGDLLSMLAADVMGDITEDARSWWALPPSASQGEVAAVLERMLSTYLAHRALMEAVVDSAVHDQRIRTQFHAIVNAGADSLADYIRTGIDAGEFDPQLNPVRTAQWLVWMIERGFYELSFPTAGGKRQRLVSALTTIVWKTLH